MSAVIIIKEEVEYDPRLLIDLRVKNELTQECAAKRAGIHEGTLWRIENGTRIRADVVNRVLLVYKKNLSDILRRREDDPPPVLQKRRFRKSRKKTCE